MRRGNDKGTEKTTQTKRNTADKTKAKSKKQQRNTKYQEMQDIATKQKQRHAHKQKEPNNRPRNKNKNPIYKKKSLPVRRMANERKTKLTDALVRILRRFLTPATVILPGLHDLYLRDNLLALAGHGDGHILTVTVALLLAILTGRSDLCIAGVFGAGKTRSLAVLLIALSCELDDFSAVVYTKENVATKALADQISDLSPPTLTQFGRLLGRIEEGKGEAFATKIDVRCNDRNRIISSKRILIATGGSARAEMSMRYSTFSQWLSRVWLAVLELDRCCSLV